MSTRKPRVIGKDHLGLGSREVPEIVLLPGDPDRVDEIAALWKNQEMISEKREYRIIKGQYHGVEMAACSTGMGGGSTEIAVIELFHHGARNMIRVGTAGGVAPDVKSGHLVVLTGCVRYSGAADAFVPVNFPAIAHYRILNALLEACKQIDVRPHVGLGATVDSFYATKPHLIRGDGKPFQTCLSRELVTWRDYRILQLDMESAVLLVLAAILGIQAGSVCTVGTNLVTGEVPTVPPSNSKAVEAACRAAALIGSGKQFF